MKTLTIYTLPGESPYQAVSRVVRDIMDVFQTDLDFSITEERNGTISVEAHSVVQVIETQTDVAAWKRIKEGLRAIAERELRKG